MQCIPTHPQCSLQILQDCIVQRLGGLLSNVRSIAEILASQGRQRLPPFMSMLPHHYCELLKPTKLCTCFCYVSLSTACVTDKSFMLCAHSCVRCNSNWSRHFTSLRQWWLASINTICHFLTGLNDLVHLWLLINWNYILWVPRAQIWLSANQLFPYIKLCIKCCNHLRPALETRLMWCGSKSYVPT